METNNIIIITFCSFSGLGLLCSLYLICQHKSEAFREEKMLQNNIKNNKVKPFEFNYTIEYPQITENLQTTEQFEETKDECENQIRIQESIV